MPGTKWFLLLARITFISNVLFIFCLLFRYTHIIIPEFIVGFMLILGWAPLSPILNFIDNFCLFILLMKGIKNAAPLWINTFNLFWMFFQIFYFITI